MGANFTQDHLWFLPQSTRTTPYIHHHTPHPPETRGIEVSSPTPNGWILRSVVNSRDHTRLYDPTFHLFPVSSTHSSPRFCRRVVRILFYRDHARVQLMGSWYHPITPVGTLHTHRELITQPPDLTSRGENPVPQCTVQSLHTRIQHEEEIRVPNVFTRSPQGVIVPHSGIPKIMGKQSHPINRGSTQITRVHSTPPVYSSLTHTIPRVGERTFRFHWFLFQFIPS